MQNLFDKASLVMVPSGYDNGKLYNIKPENKDSAFEFERATAATRVDSSGIVETFHPEATNLLLQSNNFNTTWGTPAGGISIRTSEQTGYDGTSDAWLLSKTASGNSRLIQTISSSGLKTFSLYAKEGTLKMVRLLALGGGNPEAHFNLNTGNIDVVDSDVIASNMQSVGSGWYRCSISFDDTITEVRIYPLEAQGDTTTLGNIYIQDAQLESVYFATPHIETTTEAVTRQNKANQPRIDYTSGEGTLLLEPQRTNEVTHSEDLSEYSNSNTICTLNYSLSPEGLNNSTKVRFVSSSTNSLGQNISVSSGETFTQSVFVKYIDTQFVQLFFGSSGFEGGHANFDLINKQTSAFSGATSNIEDFGNNWYRISVTKEASNAGANTKAFSLVAVDSLTSSRFNDEIDGSVEVWGAQIEEGSYATSYIPTNGETETRIYDFFENTNLADYLGTGDATFFFDFDFDVVTREGSAPTYRVYSGSTDYIGIKGVSSVNNSLQIRAAGGFVNDVNLPYNLNITSHKVLIRVNGTLVEFFHNGTKLTDTMTGLSSYNWSELRVTGNNSFLSKTKQIVIFPELLTDEESQRLTSQSADAKTFTELANNNGYTIL